MSPDRAEFSPSPEEPIKEVKPVTLAQRLRLYLGLLGAVVVFGVGSTVSQKLLMGLGVDKQNADGLSIIAAGCISATIMYKLFVDPLDKN